MYLGKIVELSPAEELYARAATPTREALLSAIPIPDPGEPAAHADRAGGRAAEPDQPAAGCRFHTRCPRATEICRTVEPPLARYPNGHLAACHHPQNVTAEEIRAATRDESSPLTSGDELPQPE